MPDGYENRYWTTALAGGTVGTMTIDVDVSRRAILGAGMLAVVSVGGVALASGCAHASPQSERNIALINDYYAAYATGNPEAVRPFLAPDVVWRIPGHHPLAGDKNGPDEVLRSSGGWPKATFAPNRSSCKPRTISSSTYTADGRTWARGRKSISCTP